MKLALFESIAPVCPGCRTDAQAWPLRIEDALRERPGLIDEGRLTCTNAACQREYPIIDGVPAEADLVALREIQTPEIDLSDLDDLEGTLELLRETGVVP